MRSVFRWRAAILTGLLVAASATPVRADANADKAAISARLQHWAAAFNTRDEAGTCDLFAPGLIATVPDALDSDRHAVCARLSALLAKHDRQFRYSPDIREIVVSGDIAVVRLFWNLTVQQAGHRQASREAGLDVFQRQPDGRWSIIRFLAFTIEPDAH